MTTTDATRFGRSIARPNGVEPLRRVLRYDAELCTISGLVLLAGAGPLADAADISATPVRLIGGFLALLALGLFLLARARTETVLRLAPISAASDIVWAIASVEVAIAVELPGWAQTAVLAQALVVAAVGVVKLRTWRDVRPRTAASA